MSTLLPGLAGHPALQIALAATAVLLFVAELGVLMFLAGKKTGSPSQNRVEMIWTVIPAVVLVGIVLLIR